MRVKYRMLCIFLGRKGIARENKAGNSPDENAHIGFSTGVNHKKIW